MIESRLFSISNVLKLAVLLFLFGGAWVKYQSEVDSVRQQNELILNHVERVEKYLSSKDPEYWKIVGDLQK